MKSIETTLREAKDIAIKYNCKQNFAELPEGHPDNKPSIDRNVLIHHPDACKWCASGALIKVDKGATISNWWQRGAGFLLLEVAQELRKQKNPNALKSSYDLQTSVYYLNDIGEVDILYNIAIERAFNMGAIEDGLRQARYYAVYRNCKTRLIELPANHPDQGTDKAFPSSPHVNSEKWCACAALMQIDPTLDVHNWHQSALGKFLVSAANELCVRKYPELLASNVNDYDLVFELNDEGHVAELYDFAIMQAVEQNV